MAAFLRLLAEMVADLTAAGLELRDGEWIELDGDGQRLDLFFAREGRRTRLAFYEMAV